MKLEVTNHPSRQGFVDIQWPGGQRQCFTGLPGVVSTPTPLCVGLDSALLEVARAAAKKFGHELEDNRLPVIQPHRTLNPELFPYQQRGTLWLLSNLRGILAWEQGLGKSACVVEMARMLVPRTILVVCPGIVRDTWLSEWEKWAPDSTRKWEVQRPGKPTCTGNFIITSYELSKKFVRREFEMIIFDEMHFIKCSKSMRASTARQIVQRSPLAAVVGLTGTPIPNQPIDLHEQISCLWPGRLGTYWDFLVRYFNLEEDPVYGKQVVEENPLKPEMLPELRARLEHYMLRLTSAEVEAEQGANFLPPLTTHPVHIEPVKALDWRELVEQFSGTMRKHREALDAHLLRAGPLKVEQAVRLAKERQAAGERPIVLTYNIDTANVIHKMLEGQNISSVCVTGELLGPARLARLRRAQEDARIIPVCSMRSIETGLTLTEFNTVIFAELYWTPGVAEQVLKRFHRIGSKLPVKAYLLIISGSLDEAIAYTLRRKLEANKACVQEGSTASKMTDGLAPVELSEEAFAHHLFEVAAKRPADNEYI